MKFMQAFVSQISSFWKTDKKPLFGTDHKEALLIKLGREQFKSLMKKGLGVPVVLL